MGQHATIHGKSTTAVNGASGSWTPIQVNDIGQLNIALLNGELTQFNRLAGGPIWNYTYVSSADTLIKSGASIFGGAFCIAAGTMAAIYDSTSATGNLLLASQVGVANTFYGPPGAGIITVNGIYADWTSGTWLVLWV